MNDIVTANIYNKDLSDLLTDISNFVKRLDGYVLEIIVEVHNDDSFNIATIYYVSK